jgi:hypothetical protein
MFFMINSATSSKDARLKAISTLQHVIADASLSFYQYSVALNASFGSTLEIGDWIDCLFISEPSERTWARAKVLEVM